MTETYRSKPLPPCKGCEARRMQNDSFELLAKGVEKARKEQRRRPKNGRAEQ